MHRSWIIALCALALLSGCRGMGFSKFDTHSFWESGVTEESKADEKFWDQLYGRKAIGHESSAWKDFYGQPADPIPKSAHCGFWGNCGAAAPAQTSSCSFYGNCPKPSSGW